jgi:hypothetical protein
MSNYRYYQYYSDHRLVYCLEFRFLKYFWLPINIVFHNEADMKEYIINVDNQCKSKFEYTYL